MYVCVHVCGVRGDEKMVPHSVDLQLEMVVSGVHGDEKMVLHSVDLQLEMAVSCLVCTGK